MTTVKTSEKYDSATRPKTVPLIAVLSNLKSTTNENGMRRVRSVMEACPNLVHYEIGDVGNLIASIDDALALFARSKPAVLVINGGDGTIGLVFAALLYRNPFKETPPIAFLPGGKTNMTAADLGYRARPDKMLQKIIKTVHAGHVPNKLAKRHVIELDMGDEIGPYVGTFFGGAGVVKAIVWCRENAYARGLPNGLAHLYSLFTLMAAAIGFGKKEIITSDTMEISIAGQGRLGGRYTAVLITTLDKLLFGLKPYGREGTGGLRFSAIETGGHNSLRAIKGLIMQSFGRKSIQGVHVRRGDLVRLKTTDQVTLDGEIYTPQKDTQIILKGDRALIFLDMLTP